MQLNKIQSETINRLRVVFILLILMYHMGAEFNYPSLSYIKILNVGYKYGNILGNSFFFMISGFLTTMIYRERIQKNKLDLLKFMGKRIKKIYPVYFIGNLFSLAVFLFRDGWKVVNIKELILSFTMTSTGWVNDSSPYNAVGWFVCVLLVCYVLFYILCKCEKSTDLYFFGLFFIIITGYGLFDKPIEIPFLYWRNGLGF